MKTISNINLVEKLKFKGIDSITKNNKFYQFSVIFHNTIFIYRCILREQKIEE